MKLKHRWLAHVLSSFLDYQMNENNNSEGFWSKNELPPATWPQDLLSGWVLRNLKCKITSFYLKSQFPINPPCRVTGAHVPLGHLKIAEPPKQLIPVLLSPTRSSRLRAHEEFLLSGFPLWRNLKLFFLLLISSKNSPNFLPWLLTSLLKAARLWAWCVQN